MDANEPINLERERRIRRKITALADAIDGAGERERYEQHPTQYLEEKAIMADELTHITYTVADVADLLHVNTDTVRRWCRDGEIQAAKIGSAGYRVSRPALEAFWRERGGGRLFGEVNLERIAQDCADAHVTVLGAASNFGVQESIIDNGGLDGEPTQKTWDYVEKRLGRKLTSEEAESFKRSYAIAIMHLDEWFECYEPEPCQGAVDHARIFIVAYACAMEARKAAGAAPTNIDGDSLLPVEPMKGDWEYLENTLGRVPTEEESEAFISAFAAAMEADDE